MLTKQQAELVWKWLIALRSGKYKQGTGNLYCEPLPSKEPHYCCLGVLGAVAGYGTLALYQNSLLYRSTFPDLHNLLGSKNCDLSDWPIAFKFAGYKFSLAYCNDKLGLNFNQIADVIQHNFYYDLKEHGYVN